MDTVRYTPLLRNCFMVMTGLADIVQEEDAKKTQQQFIEEIDLLIDHLITIKRVNALTHEASPQPAFTFASLILN
jgi:hypothetical protein